MTYRLVVAVLVLSALRGTHALENDDIRITPRHGSAPDADDRPDVKAPRSPVKPDARPAAAAHGPSELEVGFTHINSGKFADAIKHLSQFVATASSADLAQADAMAKERFGRPLPDVLVQCYTAIKCPQCKGEGVLVCDDCAGSGYTQKASMLNPGVVKGTSAPPPVHPLNMDLSSRPRVMVCFKCRGRGTDVCAQCLGTGINFVDPTPYERDAYTAYLMRQANECLTRSETSYGATPRESDNAVPPLVGAGIGDRTEINMREVLLQMWIRDSADRVKSDILRLWRAEGFFKLALKSDPAVQIKSSIDVNQELIRIGIRRKSLDGAFQERMRFKDFKREE